ncbi:MAG TPA: aminopeptidase N [Casimicrobiaceae bacterium]|jgi:aminopeptidase N|nr:aminopeptidase N [Casimicrobiaceae bacterium]
MSVPMLARGTRGKAKRRVDYRAPAFLVDDIALELDLDPDATDVAATFAFRRNPAALADDRDAPLVLDGEHQTNVRVTLDGVPLAPDRYDLAASTLTLRDAPERGTLVVHTRIAPAMNAALEGLYVSSGVFCTQCEPEGFRRIAYFFDRPDVLARYRVTLRADRARYPVLLSNGNRVDAGLLSDGRHFATWHDPFPKPTYLFAVVAGDLASLEDTFVTRSGRRVALRIYASAANIDRCGYALASLAKAMRWDEERFGREYDLDTFMIFCADDFNLGAMENKGLNIFNSRLVLADPAIATDADYNAIEGVIGHEYFHNWTGNRVTCRDWFQLSLKEGLTVFRDQEFSSDLGSRAVERIAAVEYLRREQFAEDAGPMAHPVRPDEYEEINNFYTATVYEKGAEVIRMQHELLGADRFRRAMDLYFDRHDGQAVTCDDFVQAMQDGSGVDLAQFRGWYAQAGTPRVRVHGRYDQAARRYVLDVTQSVGAHPRRASPLHVPMRIGLLAHDGSDLPIRLTGEHAAGRTTRTLEITQKTQRFEFVDVAERPVPSLFRGFSAPVQVEFDYSDDDLALLAQYDSDPVNRWDAAQRVFTDAILRLAALHRDGSALALPRLLDRIVATLVADERSDPALIALALTLPDPSYVASLEATIEPAGITTASIFVERELGRRHRAAFEAAYARNRPREPYEPTPAQAAARRLSNLCLRYLGMIDDAQSQTLVVEQYERADNMTDTIGALVALRDSTSSARDTLYRSFEAKWRDEPLVLDKWFALQAKSLRDDTLGTVRALLAHPRFNARNPNRVRSLVGSFALGNFARFNAEDGAGYAFATEQVRALDATNPQLASTIAGAFNLWKRYAEPRRGLMRRALSRIAKTPNLSPDVSEVVERTLRN